VQRYVILEQTTPGAMVFARKGEDWITELLTTPEASLNLPDIGCTIPLGECYADLDLATLAAASDA
jgi:hypothetical protein